MRERRKRENPEQGELQRTEQHSTAAAAIAIVNNSSSSIKHYWHFRFASKNKNPKAKKATQTQLSSPLSLSLSFSFSFFTHHTLSLASFLTLAPCLAQLSAYLSYRFLSLKLIFSFTKACFYFTLPQIYFFFLWLLLAYMLCMLKVLVFIWKRNNFSWWAAWIPELGCSLSSFIFLVQKGGEVGRVKFSLDQHLHFWVLSLFLPSFLPSICF